MTSRTQKCCRNAKEFRYNDQAQLLQGDGDAKGIRAQAQAQIIIITASAGTKGTNNRPAGQSDQKLNQWQSYQDNRPTLRPPGSGSESGRLGNWAAAVAVAVAVEVAGAGAQPKTERTDKPLNAVQKGAGLLSVSVEREKRSSYLYKCTTSKLGVYEKSNFLGSGKCLRHLTTKAGIKRWIGQFGFRSVYPVAGMAFTPATGQLSDAGFSNVAHSQAPPDQKGGNELLLLMHFPWTECNLRLVITNQTLHKFRHRVWLASPPPETDSAATTDSSARHGPRIGNGLSGSPMTTMRASWSGRRSSWSSSSMMKRCREVERVRGHGVQSRRASVFKGIPRITIKDIRLLSATSKDLEKEQQESDETERNGVK
uniref:HDC10037 n=1 Tax=Drosophila melanogaster TaxID=7227 RepID=Q6IL88_DROME|nr:TPA_inf: HDC10037 [Drosophila melanogaster]